MLCCGVVERLKTRDDKVIKLDIKWDEQFVACGESDIYWNYFLESQHTEERGMEAGRERILEEN